MEEWVTNPGGEIRRGNTMHSVLSASILPSCFKHSPALQVGYPLCVLEMSGALGGCRKVKGLG